jgi:hypothetical protein
LVFLNATGSAWKQASRDIKNYLQDTLGIPADVIDPSGRFVHGSRSIMLANYALRVRFDPLKLQQFATLMRHSFATMNSYYLLWTDWATAKIAMNDFNQAFGLPMDNTSIPTDFSQFDVQFSFPPEILENPESKPEIQVEKPETQEKIQADQQNQKSEKPDSKPEIQVEKSENQEKKRENNNCDRCGGVMRIYGPYGKRRHEKQYGCYWYQCVSCVPLQKKWIPLGFMTEYSNSRKSKKHETIIQFIKKSINRLGILK